MLATGRPCRAKSGSCIADSEGAGFDATAILCINHEFGLLHGDQRRCHALVVGAVDGREGVGSNNCLGDPSGGAVQPGDVVVVDCCVRQTNAGSLCL